MRHGRFEGAIAVITGGASGIGLALGAELRRAGATVVLADCDDARVKAAATEIDQHAAGLGHARGPATRGHEVEVRHGDEVDDFVSEVLAEHGRIDFMFNNAGIALGGETHTLPIEHAMRVLDVNLGGVVNGVAAVYPRMVDQGFGHIVNTSSLMGLAPAPFVPAYAASKYAVVGFSRALRPEAARHGVRVSVVCPGAVDTSILDGVTPSDLPAHDGRSMNGREYLRVAGLPLMAPDRFARRALRGVARNRGVIVVGAAARGLWLADRLSPSMVDRVNGSMARRLDRAMDEAARDTMSVVP